MRRFYLAYAGRADIAQSQTGPSGAADSAAGIAQFQTGQSQAAIPFRLSWTHYVFLLGINYVNYFDRHVKTEAENATVGIVLCKKKNEALVEITLPADANIHAREYSLYLPSKEELRAKLREWTDGAVNEPARAR